MDTKCSNKKNRGRNGLISFTVKAGSAIYNTTHHIISNSEEKIIRVSMGKNEKTGLGRALVKHHNQMIQQSKDKDVYYRNQRKKVLESVTDVTDIDAIIEQTDEPPIDIHPVPNLHIDLLVSSPSIYINFNHSFEYLSFFNCIFYSFIEMIGRRRVR